MEQSSEAASRARRLVPPALLVIALIGFQLVYGLRLLSAGDAFWSNPPGDMGQMLAGALAGLRAPWSVPILTPDTLLAPARVSLVYTDSIPWLTALLKLAHLGGRLNVLGTALLLAWLAQPAAMYALLRAAGVRRASTLFAGGVLALLVPAWLARQIGHIALSCQAVELAALALAVDAARRGVSTRTAVGFTALGVLVVGVHAYFAPVVTLLLAASLASDVLQRRARGGVRAMIVGLVYLGAVLSGAWFLGYFVGRGASGGVDALGFWEMNLVSPFLPQASALAGQRWANGWFTHQFDPTGGQVFEGFDYQGAGALLLWAAALVLLLRERRRRAASRGQGGPTPEPAGGRLRWAPLAAALVLLTIYAVGPNPYLGTVRLFSLPLPHAAWTEPLSLFRCHGRFFWTVGYALLAGALTVVDRAAGARTRTLLLCAAVLLQATDMSQMLWGLHDRFSGPEALRVPAALRGPAFRGRSYRVYPTFFCTASATNQEIVRQLALIAQRQGASINAAETARPPKEGCVPPPPDARIDAAPGDRRLTVLMSGDGLPSETTSLFARRRDCVSLTSWWMCGRELQGLEGAQPVEGRTLLAPKLGHPDAELRLGSASFKAALASGWSGVEPTGVWSDGPHVVLRLPRVDVGKDGFAFVTLDAIGYQPARRAPQRAFVSVGGRRLADWRLDGGGYHGLSVAVPGELLPPAGPLEVDIDLPDARSPNLDSPGAGDPRRLALGVRAITLAH